MSSLQEDAVAIFQASLRAVDPVVAVKRNLERQGDLLRAGASVFDLKDVENVFVVGAGKAAAAMAQPVEEILKDRLSAGLVNTKYGYGRSLQHIQVTEAGHPIPDEAGWHGAKKIMTLARRATEKDLVVFLLSGGGSALLPAPAEGLTLEEKKKVTRLLLESGATIHEVNTIRKHISQIKGGQLARLAYPATLLSFFISDVVGDRLDTIASGPTVPDQTTFQDCWGIIEKYKLAARIPPAVLRHLKKGLAGEIPDTPKPGDPVFTKAQNLVIASNAQALEAAAEKARSLGYSTLLLSTSIEGEAREVARTQARLIREIVGSGRPVGRPVCLISGGETTVTVRGSGLGGRCQEFCLAAAIEIEGLEEVLILSAGTDGSDGPTDAAGAFADGTTIQRGRQLGLKADAYLRNNDSYHFFQPLGDLFITGPTFTNVMDLYIVLIR